MEKKAKKASSSLARNVRIRFKDAISVEVYPSNINVAAVTKDLKMGMSAAQFKIMPESPDTDLNAITEKAKTILEESDGVFSSSEEQPIAFGLKALILSIAYPEEKEIDEVENLFGEIEGVSSAEMIDYRRALG